MKKNSHSEIDVVLIGAGIMSATLGVLLKELQPNLSILVVLINYRLRVQLTSESNW